jgi:hypothetical protein
MKYPAQRLDIKRRKTLIRKFGADLTKCAQTNMKNHIDKGMKTYTCGIRE